MSNKMPDGFSNHQNSVEKLVKYIFGWVEGNYSII